MKRKSFYFVIPFIFLFPSAFAQHIDCHSNLEWIQTTLEDNDAGFEHVVATKGESALENHNRLFLEKAKSISDQKGCLLLLNEWTKFFRSGHLYVEPNNQDSNGRIVQTPKFDFELASFKNYLDTISQPGFEGIWEFNGYRIGIKKEKNEYIGFIIDSDFESWKKGDVKLRFNLSPDSESIVFYNRDRSIRKIKREEINLIENQLIKIKRMVLLRLYPEMEIAKNLLHYEKSSNASKPFLEKMNNHTFYFRIPSFSPQYKKAIDQLIEENKQELSQTENLIIDIRGNGGGSDISYKNIIPFLYTNPIRHMAVAYKSTKLNNRRMLDLINNPEYGLDEESKQWARKAYKQLESRLNEFVNLGDEDVVIQKQDSVYPFPKQVGIIIDQGVGSSAEQFLIEAKQSKKVKLFGVPTFGAVDIANMYEVETPSGDFILEYALSRSLRLPEMVIDEAGIQPDFFIDNTIPHHEWLEFVKNTLE